MALCRADFLRAGHYQKLSSLVEHTFVAHLESTGPRCDSEYVVDVGCGPGHFLAGVGVSISARFGNDTCCIGVDASKEAVRLAARAHPELTCVVADSRQSMPLVSGNAVCVLNMFAPRNEPEFRRIISTDGMLLIVFPGAGHLSDLVEHLGLLGLEPEKEASVVRQMSPSFTQISRQELDYPLELSGSDLVNLIDMGPNYWHKTDKMRESINNIKGPTRTRAAFTLIGFAPRVS